MLLAAVRPTAIVGAVRGSVPGDKVAGPDAHQELFRQAAAAADLRGRRRDPASVVLAGNSPSSTRRTGSRARIAPSRKKKASWCPPTT